MVPLDVRSHKRCDRCDRRKYPTVRLHHRDSLDLTRTSQTVKGRECQIHPQVLIGQSPICEYLSFGRFNAFNGRIVDEVGAIEEWRRARRMLDAGPVSSEFSVNAQSLCHLPRGSQESDPGPTMCHGFAGAGFRAERKGGGVLIDLRLIGSSRIRMMGRDVFFAAPRTVRVTVPEVISNQSGLGGGSAGLFQLGRSVHLGSESRTLPKPR